MKTQRFSNLRASGDSLERETRGKNCSQALSSFSEKEDVLINTASPKV